MFIPRRPTGPRSERYFAFNATTAIVVGGEWQPTRQHRFRVRRAVQPDVIDGFPTSGVATPANWGDIEEWHRPNRRRWLAITQPDHVEAFPFAPQQAFTFWYEADDGYRAPRRRFPNPVQPDNIDGLPFTTAGNPRIWQDIEEWHAAPRRRWPRPVQPDNIDGFPFTSVPPVEAWYELEEPRRAQKRRLNPNLQAWDFVPLAIAPIEPWGFDWPESPTPRRKLWLRYQQDNIDGFPLVVIGPPAAAPRDWEHSWTPRRARQPIRQYHGLLDEGWPVPLPPPPPPQQVTSPSFAIVVTQLESQWRWNRLTDVQYLQGLYAAQWAWSGLRTWYDVINAYPQGKLVPAGAFTFPKPSPFPNDPAYPVDVGAILRTYAALVSRGATAPPAPPRWVWGYLGFAYLQPL